MGRSTGLVFIALGACMAARAITLLFGSGGSLTTHFDEAVKVLRTQQVSYALSFERIERIEQTKSDLLLHVPHLRAKDVEDQQRTAMTSVDPLITSREQMVQRHGVNIRAASNVTLEEMMRTELTPEMQSKRVVYFITPTYNRPSQMVDMIRVKQALELASIKQHRLIYWIVIEDSSKCTKRVRDLLKSSGLDFAHVAIETPVKNVTKPITKKPTLQERLKKRLKKGGALKKSLHKGVPQRNLALDIVEQVDAEGVVYFGDDDNAYDTQLFSELVLTKRVSIFGVGFSAGTYERCQVDPKTGMVVKIVSGWGANRTFSMDMAGFAFSTSALLRSTPRFNNKWVKGYLETNFMEMMVPGVSDLEPLAANCTKILAWHVKTTGAQLRAIRGDKDNYGLVKQLV